MEAGNPPGLSSRSSSATARRTSPSSPRSTATSERTITWEDGNTYPVVDVDKCR